MITDLDEAEEEIIIEGVTITLKTNSSRRSSLTNANKIPFSMSTLINGKTALTSKNRSKKESVINQALPRAFLNQFSTGPENSQGNRPQYARSNTITSLVASAFTGNSLPGASRLRSDSDGAVKAKVTSSSSSSVQINVNGLQVNLI